MKSRDRVEPTIITKIDYQNVVVKTFIQPNNALVTHATFAKEGYQAAAVIAITGDYKVVVARQFRPGPERIMDELPGGFIDENENPEDAARRELLEETGYVPGDITFLGKFNRDAYANGEWFYFLATDCSPLDQQQLEEDEFVEIVLLSIGEFIESAKKGSMTDPAAVLAAYDQLKRIQEENSI